VNLCCPLHNSAVPSFVSFGCGFIMQELVGMMVWHCWSQVT
jgi:hypothetical protein